MKYLLDTNIIIDHLRMRFAVPSICTPKNSFINAVIFGELLYGAEKSTHKNKAIALVEEVVKNTVIDVIPVTSSTFRIYASVKRTLQVKGTIIEDFDLLVAATALEHNLTLVTRNTKHFKRIPSLKLYEG